MTTYALLFAILLSGAQDASPQIFTGRLSDRLVSETRMAAVELKAATDIDLPGTDKADKVYASTLPMLKGPGAPKGFAVALVEGKRGTFIFTDNNMDGRLSESERVPYPLGAHFDDAKELTLEVRPDPARNLTIPVRARVFAENADGTPRREFLFTPIFRVEGHIDIAGRRTLVWLPLKLSTMTVDLQDGRIGIDTNGDGIIATGSLSPELVALEGEKVVLRAGDRYMSLESTDLDSGIVTFRERSREDYTLIEAVPGSTIQDFSFTDFDGKDGRLSDYRGKYLLLDFWGSWCKPCVDDVPAMKAAHDRFRDQGFEILGLDFENGNKADSVRPFIKDKALSWRNATPESVKDLIEKRFRVMGFPTLILLDPNGAVIETNTNELRGEKLIQTLERFMKKLK